jgi:hypothetical protein
VFGESELRIANILYIRLMKDGFFGTARDEPYQVAFEMTQATFPESRSYLVCVLLRPAEGIGLANIGEILTFSSHFIGHCQQDIRLAYAKTPAVPHSVQLLVSS